MPNNLILRPAKQGEADLAMQLINMAKAHLKAQGIDQWQTGYPDSATIAADLRTGKGFFVLEGESVLGYLCIDFDGEPAYEGLQGTWVTEKPYVVVHRLAFSDEARGKGLAEAVFRLVEELALSRGVTSFRVDTDEGNLKMRHILTKCGFAYRGVINFDNSLKLAFDKQIS